MQSCHPPAAGEIFHRRQTYMAMVESEKVFDRVQKAIWWAMRKLVLWEGIVNLVLGMYANVRSCLWVGEGLSDDLQERFGVHQRLAVLSPQLFNIMLDALSQ